jgi:hypothetical protein
MNKLDQVLCGLGATLVLVGLSFVDNARTNRKLRRSASAVEGTAREVSTAVRSCIVPVNRGGKTVHAMAMTTPALASSFNQFSK